MKSNETLIKAKQKLNRAQLELARAREKERKLDVHKKIQLGGLVIKSGMDQFSKAVILGALVDAMQQIKNDPTMENIYKLKGDHEFLNQKV